MNDSLYHYAGLETRWASPENPDAAPGKGGQANGGRKGRASLRMTPGETVILAHCPVGTSGMIRRIWLTVDDRSPDRLRSLILRAFWDSSPTPAIEVPLGDFFGIGLGRTAAFDSALFSNPEDRSFNSVVPMPFRDGMRLTLTNDHPAPLTMLFYDVNYTLGDAHGLDTLYLHAHFNRENPTRLQTDYTIVPPTAGRGRYLGANLGLIVDKACYGPSWWGEGEVKIYLDGNTDFPTLCGTGTEDYIGTAWGQGRFTHRYQGCPLYDDQGICFYRYHIPDPVYFASQIRVTLQQIGGAFGDGKVWLRTRFQQSNTALLATAPGAPPLDLSGDAFVLFERADDVSSCAYVYLDTPQKVFPGLPPREFRLVTATSSQVT